MNNNITIYRIYYRLPPNNGGMEQHILRLSSTQRLQGIEVINIFNTGQAIDSSIEILKKIRLNNIKPAFLRNAIFYIGIYRVINNGSVMNGKVVLHIHGDWSDFLFSKILSLKLKSVLTIASLHGVIKKKISLLYKISLSHCKIIYTTGKEEQNYLKHILKRKVYHLPSAPAKHFFYVGNNSQKNYDVIKVANLYPVKNIISYLEIAQKRPNLRFVLVGDGPMRNIVEEHINENNIDNIIMLGSIRSKQVASEMSKSRLFLSTSFDEGTPTSVLEAMAVGLPIVITPSNNYDWLIRQGINGYVTRTWSIEEIIKYIDILLKNNILRNSMEKNNIKKIRKYTWEKNAAFINKKIKEKL